MFLARLWTFILCSVLITSTASAWSPPVDLSEIGLNSHQSQIAVDTDGNATAVWTETIGEGTFIRASTRLFGDSWQAPVTISQLATPSIPQIAVDGQNNVTAVWKAYDGSNWIIQSATKLFGGNWQDPEKVSLSGQDGDTPQIAVDLNGNATVVWQTATQEEYSIQASTKFFGSRWQDTPDLLSGPGALFPQIAVDPNGNAVAVWEAASAGSSVIQSSTKLFGESWQNPVGPTSSSTYCHTPQVGIDENGTATVVWSGTWGEGYFVVQASTMSLTGSWQSTQLLSSETALSTLPQIAVNARGDAIVVWIANWYDQPAIVQSSMRPSGENWQPSPDNLFLTSFQSGNPGVAIDPYGDAVAVWMWRGTEGGPQIIQSSTKLFERSWQATPDNVSLAEREGNYPQVAIDAKGNATAVWEWFDGTNWLIQSASNYFGPTVTALSSKSGLTTGGNSVTITGTDFHDVTAVTFGSTPATSFSVESDTTIIATVPPGKGTVDVFVTAFSIASPSSTVDQYSYINPSPARRFDGKGRLKGKKLFLKTKWKRSSATNACRYEIFAWGRRVETIFAWNNPKATIQLHHSAHHISKGYRRYLHKKYKIRVVDSLGATSSFTKLNVRGHVQG